MLGGLFGRGDKNKTFKPLKPHARGDKQKALHQYAKATLGSGDVRSAVALPPGESEDEWIALHVTDCYNELSLLYGAVSEWCTRDACPVMCVGLAPRPRRSRYRSLCGCWLNVHARSRPCLPCAQVRRAALRVPLGREHPQAHLRVGCVRGRYHVGLGLVRAAPGSSEITKCTLTKPAVHTRRSPPSRSTRVRGPAVPVGGAAAGGREPVPHQPLQAVRVVWGAATDGARRGVPPTPAPTSRTPTARSCRSLLSARAASPRTSRSSLATSSSACSASTRTSTTGALGGWGRGAGRLSAIEDTSSDGAIPSTLDDPSPPIAATLTR